MKTKISPTTFIALCLSLLLITSACTPPTDQQSDKQPTKSEVFIWEYTADHHARKGEYTEATRELEKVLATPLAAPKHYLQMGEYLELSDRLEKAIEVYRQGIERLPAGAATKIRHRAAMALIETGDIEAATQIAEETADSLEKQDMLGIIALKRKRIKQAYNHFNSAIARYPKGQYIGWVHYHTALMYDQAGDSTNTGDALYKAISTAQGNRLLTDKIKTLWSTYRSRK